MTVISRIALAVFVAALISAPLSAQESLARIRGASPLQLDNYLPALPADMPWLFAGPTNPATAPALPEVTNLQNLFWQPTPVEAWSSPPTTQSATVSGTAGG
jgi:hypothetical protein